MTVGTLVQDPAVTRVLFVRRLLLLALFMLLGFALLGWRLYQLQIVQHQRFVTASVRNRIAVQPLAPVRGLIYDRNGVVLAENLPTVSLQIVPEQVPDLEETLGRLGRLLTLDDQDLRRFRQRVRRKRSFEPVVLREQLSDRELAVFAARQHLFPGVGLQGDLRRHYPFAELTAHAVGYVGRITGGDLQRLEQRRYAGGRYTGKAGLERAYEDILYGRAGYREVEVDAHGRVLKTEQYSPPQAGGALHLTLDITLQRVAYEALGEHRGAVVAIDPRDGGVLALVSKPGFDSNLFVAGLSQARYQSLLHGAGRPLFNRALGGQYPPGSTIKPFVALAGLELGTTDRQHRVFCSGAFQLPGQQHKYRCWKRHGHGYMNLHDAIVHSCDIYFYDLALRMGIDPMHDFLAGFGFGEATGIDSGSDAAGLLPSSVWKRNVKGVAWYPGETLIAGIGQGFDLSTPLQLAVATATLANRGVARVPHLAAGPSPATVAVEATAGNWQQVIDAMHDVVQKAGGTAWRSGRGAGYRFAGKTGTAQVYGLAQDDQAQDEPAEVARKLRDHALFIAFAPLENPTIAVAVVVENGGSGSAAAAPVARQILDAWLVHDTSQEAS